MHRSHAARAARSVCRKKIERARVAVASQHMRKRIEEHFEDVKDATEAQESPTLPLELSDWIAGVCDEACGLVRDVPASLRTKLAPAARYLHATSPTR